ncbi:hypothetical protein HPB50_006193 [Hyalomma asiaticum]|uniref:Uncharacterized protein n=1 Tax=Hyalomma asiaticum TaxID=266040 RepID=A0ACB7RS49_HYAAI|nr:hypothetical protein HPB50_006193 [Hyalomma asiaticum]
MTKRLWQNQTLLSTHGPAIPKHLTTVLQSHIRNAAIYKQFLFVFRIHLSLTRGCAGWHSSTGEREDSTGSEESVAGVWHAAWPELISVRDDDPIWGARTNGVVSCLHRGAAMLTTVVSSVHVCCTRERL